MMRLVAVLAVNERPDLLGVLRFHKSEFLAVGLEEASARLSDFPTGILVEVVGGAGVRNLRQMRPGISVAD